MNQVVPTPSDEPPGSPSARKRPHRSTGLRQRKMLQTRQLLSDTATAMFLERGFEDVRVADVADACNVSEKTVYNYFPNKESLLFDQEEQMQDAVRGATSVFDGSPVGAMLTVLDADLTALTDDFASRGGAADMTVVQRFGELIERTPSLRAHHRDSIDRLVSVAADNLARRAGLPPHTPQVQATAFALIALWRIQLESLQRHVDGVRTPEQVAELVMVDVHSAAQAFNYGLEEFWVKTSSTVDRDEAEPA